MSRFFTSDHHFGHANIIRFCNRPFDSLHHMDEQLIELWNSVVRKGDDVYHLGDLFFKCSPGYAHGILDKLNGNITVILGNHDKIIRNQKPIRDRLKAVHEGFIEIPFKPWSEQKMTLCHYKMQVWNKSHYGSWHIYGHSHSGEYDCKGVSANVCVDLWNYVPIHEATLAGYLGEKAKDFTPPFGKEKPKGHVEHF